MSLRRHRIPIAALMSAPLLAGLAVAGSSAATTSVDTVAEASVAKTADTVAGTSDATTAEVAPVEILPPDEPWAGLTRAEWDARTWQWNVSMPQDINPGFDPTGDRCGYGQSGPVFFLTANSGGAQRTCVVAEGTAIFVPVVVVECSTVEPPPFFGRTEDELRACATEDIDQVTDVQARVNGQDVANLANYRTASSLFTLTFPDNNIFGVEPSVAHAVSDGYSFIIAPPPPGTYEITWSAMYPDNPHGGTAIVIVEAPRVIEPPTT